MTTVRPKWSRATLDVINNTFAVPNGLLFDYYPISCHKNKMIGPYLKIVLSPGIMAEGFAIINKTVYSVSLRDLQRRRINVNNERTEYASSTAIRKPKESKPTAESTNPADEQGPFDLSRDQVGQAANVAWEDEINSLFQTLYSKEGEEWEIESAPQSRSVDEDSAASAIFSDIGPD